MSNLSENLCPGCGERRLKSYSELSEEERTIVARLPASADTDVEERARRHKWCTRCWRESSGDSPTIA